jgi:8-oxo-dGTP pyrophosphatase MutT (NUDIX family)
LDTVSKVYGYVTRIKKDKTQILVFKHPNPEAGIQIPKGTVRLNENPFTATVREIKEETGLMDFQVEGLLAEDYWTYDDGALHHRFFYKLRVTEDRDEWVHYPTGGGFEEELFFEFFWISSKEEVELVRGHADYLDLILSKEP